MLCELDFDKTTLLVTKLLILKMMVGQGNK